GLEEGGESDGGVRCASEVGVGQAGQRRDRRAGRRAGVDEELELGVELEVPNAHCADLADPRAAGAEAGRLEIDDDERRAVERDVGAWRPGEPGAAAAPGEACGLADD